MSHISDTTLALTGDRNAVELDWILQKIIGRYANHAPAEIIRATNEIHTTLINAGWRCGSRDADNGNDCVYYRQLSDQKHSLPDRQPASGGSAKSAHQQTAPEILAAAAQCISDRAATRDLPAERSMARNVRAFNVLTGHTLTERDGWLFMVTLQAARATAGSHNPDDYIDGAAYFALAGESAQTTEGKNP